jgi:hypothetical protein
MVSGYHFGRTKRPFHHCNKFCWWPWALQQARQVTAHSHLQMWDLGCRQPSGDRHQPVEAMRNERPCPTWTKQQGDQWDPVDIDSSRVPGRTNEPRPHSRVKAGAMEWTMDRAEVPREIPEHGTGCGDLKAVHCFPVGFRLLPEGIAMDFYLGPAQKCPRTVTKVSAVTWFSWRLSFPCTLQTSITPWFCGRALVLLPAARPGPRSAAPLPPPPAAATPLLSSLSVCLIFHFVLFYL